MYEPYERDLTARDRTALDDDIPGLLSPGEKRYQPVVARDASISVLPSHPVHPLHQADTPRFVPIQVLAEVQVPSKAL